MPADSTTSDPQSPRFRKVPLFYREENSTLIVKGNFMTLAAKPHHIEIGEWLAHQVVEQYRLLEGMLRVIQEPDSRTKIPLCNPTSCPTMSAAEYVTIPHPLYIPGAYAFPDSRFTYTWLDNQRNAVRIPAPQYINLVQKWIMGKIQDPTIFPIATLDTNASVKPAASQPGQGWVGKGSGFPQTFETDIRSLYRQMFRCYAHIYHGHWLDPFYHIGAYRELNTCFIHFVNVGTSFDLLHERDMKPLQPLIDIWQAKGLLPHLPDPKQVALPAELLATQPASAGAST